MSDKRIYQICCSTESDWDFVHEILIKDGTLEDNIPSRAVELIDYKEHSPTRSTYLMTDEEAELLKANPRIKFVNIDYASYPEYRPPKEELHAVPYRYVNAVKNYRNFSNPSIVPSSVNVSETDRAGYQLLRMTQKENPWYGISNQTVIMDTIPNTATGIGVDVIVGDDGCDFGHAEFQTNTGSGPTDLIGENVLSNSGTCMLIDLVLEAPYYIDPNWFNASPGTRLTTRWDGTTVPVESVARNWWSNSAQRSSAFSSIGTVAINATYTRANCNGDNLNTPNEGDHGTCCGALTYGRTQGWAYNANKFFINVYGTYGVGIEQYFDLVKIFHNNKPINATYGTRNPTITSNSWGYRAVQAASGAYYFRQGTTGTGGVTFTTGNQPNFIKYLGSTGDSGRFKGEMLTNSLTQAGEELIQAGVIFVVAAGNSNQQQVGSDQPDYNNYWASGLNVPLSSATHDEFGITCYNTTSRRGFPQQLGQYVSGGKVVYPAINIGALDDQSQADGKERKVNYSDMGEQIDVYAPADGTMAANRGYTPQYIRADTYPGSGTPSGFTAMCNAIAQLNGTSSFDAAPNTGWRLVTTSDTTATLTSIPSELKGSTGLSQLSLSGGDSDDGYFGVNISGGGGFTITFADSTFGNVYISTNSLVTFTSGYIDLTFNVSTPTMRKICINAADNSCQRCYGGFEGTSPNRKIRFRFEGTNDISGVVGSPNMVWELTLYENARNQFDVQIGENARYVTEANFYDFAFGGTSAACPVSTGFIATKLQNNRSWTWQDIRNWLQTLEIQDSTKFYQGPTPTTATSADWADLNSLMGGTRRVLYNAPNLNQNISFSNITFNGLGLTFS